MNNTESRYLLRDNRAARRLVVGGTTIVFMAAVGWWFGLFRGTNLPEVDFEEVVSEENGVGDVAHDSRPTLRVAVAAMLSPKPTSEYYEGLLRLIANKVGRRPVFLQRRTYGEVSDLLDRKELDIAFVCAGPYVTGHERFGMEILVVPVVRGKKVYHSYIIANREGELESFDDLKGKRFAFTDPRSNTGYLVPKHILSQRGHTPESFFGETFFTYSHDNSIKAVAEGLADGAAVDSLVWEFMNQTDPTHTSGTTIIARSPPFGIPPVVIHPDIDPHLKLRLREVFLSLDRDEEASSLLNQLGIDRFEEGEDAMYDSVREMQSSGTNES
jgi:phosphonate transport system substrate-binding protein